jgi:hypothetical protein
MTYHILNGDALAERFPDSIIGDRIIMRECLVDGPIQFHSYDELVKNRAEYLNSTYPLHSSEKYERFVEPELKKIMNIPPKAEIYLWFEEDVFCQVNCWFICYLLEQHLGENEVFLVMLNSELQWGFAGLNEHDLVLAYERAIQVTGVELIELAKLWQAYQESDIMKMRELTIELSRFDWVKTAVDAEIDRIVENTPYEILRSLINQLGSENFGPVFQEFNKLAAIYGYGDLMVKRMFDEIVASKAS